MLYELSLAVGGSLELDEACGTFLSLLVDRKNLDYASVWIADDELSEPVGEGGMTLVCALPRSRACRQHLELSHPSFAGIGAGGHRNIVAADDDFTTVCDESGVTGGGYALFDLDGVGLLKLLTHRDEGFSNQELNQLHKVIVKFAKSLRGTLSHARLLSECYASKDAAQRTQHEQSSLLATVVNSVPDLFFYKDLDGVYLGCNRAFEEYTGKSGKDIIGRTDHDLFDAETADFFRSMDAAMVATGHPRRNEEWITYPDGHRVLLDTLKTPILSADGDMFGLIGVGRDITERSRADESVRRRLKLENSISLVSSNFVGKIDHDRAIDASLAELAVMSEADRVYLVEFDEPTRTMSCTHEWCGSGVETAQQSLQQVPIPALGCLVEKLTGRDRFVIPNVDGYQTATPEGRILLDRRGARSIIVMPVRIEGSLEGFVGFDYRHGHHQRTREDMVMMQVASQIIGRALERRRADDFLHRYKHVVSVAQDMISLVDRDYRYQLVNSACEQAHGVPAEELIGTDVAGFVGPQTFENEIRGELDRCLAGETVRQQHWLDLPHVGMRYLDVLYSPYRGGQRDAVEGAVISVRDFTEQKQWEDALQQSEAKIRSIVRAAPVGIGVVNDRRFVEVNDRFCIITGYDRTELIGRSTRMVYPSDAEWDAVLEEKLRQIEADGIGTVETTVVRKDGSLVTLLLSSTPINPRDHGEGFTFTALDITERRQTEDALRRSQKMDAIGQMAGGIAHDFNNVLGIVLGNLNLLRRSLRHEPAALKRIDSIEKSALRAADLTNHLLTFSRREPGNLSQINVNDVVTEMHSLMTRSVTPEIAVRTRLAKSPWPADIDRGDLEDSLLNLVLNARDAMPRGGTLTIETANLSVTPESAGVDLAAGDYVVISVVDTGIGIAEENLEHIFEPFFTTKTEGRGTGLGLSMVFGFVKRCRGHIRVQSRVGAGTTFRIYLPRATNTQQQGDAASAPQADLSAGSETILVVDDESDLVELTAEVLESLGYRVVTAPSGVVAREILDSRDDIDLVFTDVVMPGGVSGYDLAGHVREKHPAIRVLLTSGYTGKSGYGESDSGEFGELLKKPYTEEDLAERIRKLLDDRPRSAHADGAAATDDPDPDGPPTAPVIGIASIDESHDAIVALLDRARRLAGRGIVDEQLGAILVELEDHVTAHFEDEESILERYACSGRGEHVAEHRRLSRTVVGLRRQLEADRLQPRDIKSFLLKELIPHITAFDAAIAECVRNHRPASHDSRERQGETV